MSAKRSQSSPPATPLRSDYFLPYQQRWIVDESTLKLDRKSRRVGITYGTSYRANGKCLRRKNFTQWVTSRDLLTAKEFVTDYIAKWAKASNVVARGLNGDNVQVVDELRGITAFIVEYETGCRVVSLSSTPEAFAGKGGDVLIDEADLHQDSGKVIDMAMPCITWGNQLEVVSALRVDGSPNTPFCKIITSIEQGGNPQGWSYHKTTILDAVAEGFVEKINQVTGSNHTRDAWLQMMHARCRNEQAWQTQYMCEPADDGGSMLTYDMIDACEVPDIGVIEDTQPMYLGMDIGRRHDLTVIWLLQKIGDVFWTRAVRVLEKTPFRDQLDVLSSYLEDPRIRRACIDSTGLGAMLAEEAQRRWGQYRVEAVTFTPAAKEEMAMGMLTRFQDKQVRIPTERDIREDLHKIRKVTTAAGNIRYEAERDDAGHSDRFWALALGLHAGATATGPVDFALPTPRNTWGSAPAGADRTAAFGRPDHSDDVALQSADSRRAW